MNNINSSFKKIPSTLEILTPVHIGSGVKLLKNFDFFIENNSTKIVDKKELDLYLREHPDELNKFLEKNFIPLEIIKKINYKKSYNLYCNSKEIIEFERNGRGEPYIPGSSIKGALRTKLFNYYFNSKSETEKNELFKKINKSNRFFASEKLLKEIFGIDSNHDLMRVIEVYDCPLNEDSINLFKIHVLTLTDKEGKSFKWKKMPHGSTDNLNESTALFVEMLNPGEKFNFSIRINNFLLKNEICKKELNFDENLNINQLSNNINNYSLEKLSSEIEFFKRIENKSVFEKILNNLSNIKGEIENNINNNNNCLIMKMGWGIGWKDMTGDFLNDDELKEMRKIFALGKKGYDIFPKTRKIIFVESKPIYVSGWIKITFFDEVSNKKSDKNSDVDNNYLGKLSDKFKISKI